MSHAAANAICANIVNFVNFAGSVDARAIHIAEWASVTFSGARHQLRVVLTGPGAVGAAADFLACLPALEFRICGHVVADVALLAEERGDGGTYAKLELEALTIEDT